jgi:hypothetical protein
MEAEGGEKVLQDNPGKTTKLLRKVTETWKKRK